MRTFKQSWNVFILICTLKLFLIDEILQNLFNQLLLFFLPWNPFVKPSTSFFPQLSSFRANFTKPYNPKSNIMKKLQESFFFLTFWLVISNLGQCNTLNIQVCDNHHKWVLMAPQEGRTSGRTSYNSLDPFQRPVI